MKPRSQTAKSVLYAAGAMLALITLATLALVLAGLRDDLAPSDLALVLGNKIEINGRPSARLQARLDKAAELYAQGKFPLILVSGGIGREGFDEAVVMRSYLIAHGVPISAILTDNRGDTTFASAAHTQKILQERKLHSVLVITQYFHAPRSRLALSRFGVAEIRSAHPRYFEWRDFYSAPRELFGWLYYFFRGYPAGLTSSPPTS